MLHLVAEHCCVTYRRRREHRSCFLQSMKGRQGSPFALGVSGASSSYCPSPAHAGSRGGCWTQAVSCCSQLQLWGPGPASCSDESWEVIVAVEILLKKKNHQKPKRRVQRGTVCMIVTWWQACTKLLGLGLCSYNDGSVMSISLCPPPQ